MKVLLRLINGVSTPVYMTEAGRYMSVRAQARWHKREAKAKSYRDVALAGGGDKEVTRRYWQDRGKKAVAAFDKVWTDKEMMQFVNSWGTK
jgi:hypothetical protein